MTVILFFDKSLSKSLNYLLTSSTDKEFLIGLPSSEFQPEISWVWMAGVPVIRQMYYTYTSLKLPDMKEISCFRII